MTRFNMSYVKFENTFTALKECASEWDEVSSASEAKAKADLIKLMQVLLAKEQNQG